MKNNYQKIPIFNISIFKSTLLCLFLGLVSMAIGKPLHTNDEPALNRKLTIQMQQTDLKSILLEIEKQIGVKFKHEPTLLQGIDRVSIDVTDATLEAVLAQILTNKFKYEVDGDHILITQNPTADKNGNDPAAASDPVAMFISGKVSDETGQPMPGVTVQIKGTGKGTITDAEGNYNIESDEDDVVLVFSFVGFLTQEVSVNSKGSLGQETVAKRSGINVTLLPDVTTLSEVVVVGYGEQKKITVTGSVVAVSGTELIKSPAPNLSNSFSGRLAGVVAVQESGEPGNDNSTIRIRGVNTTGNTSPLIVIDGIPDRDGGLNRISPQDVESISVLKDASAAIYGARAANGVILITTKRGKTGPAQVSYDYSQGWSQPTVIPEMANASEYAAIMNEIPLYKNIPANEWVDAWAATKQAGTYTSPITGKTINANYSPTDVQKFADGSDPWGHPNTDWFKGSFKNWASQTRHNVQIAGGTDNVKYLSSIGYVNQDGIYKNSATKYEQYNFRLNLDARVNKYINTSLGLMAREEVRNNPTQGTGAIFRMLMRGRPTEPQVWPNGLPGPDIENGQNPYVITTNATGYIKNPTSYVQSNAKVELTNPWIEGLKLTLVGAADQSINRIKQWDTPWYLYTWDKKTFEADGVTPKLDKSLRSSFTDSRLTQSTGTVTNTNLTAMLNYDRTWGDHTLGILVGTTREQFQGDFIQANRRDFISSVIDQPFFGGTTQLITGGDDNRNTYNRARLGYYGRVTYNYKEKYLAEFTWRRDGSSFFAPANRFGFFPGILAGWNISNESFFSKNVKFVNFLKIRASYGTMGGDQIYNLNNDGTVSDRLVEFAYLSLYNPGQFPINSKVATTLTEGYVLNNNFTWERANNANFGIEGTMFDNRINFTVEYFYNKRSSMLIQKKGSTTATSGILENLPPVNLGEMTNKGIEFAVDYNGTASGLTYKVGVNAGYNKNNVEFQDESAAAPEYQRQTGHQFGAYLAYQSNGAFRDQAEIDNNRIDYSAVTDKLLPGDMKFVDYNGDGKIDANDKYRLDKTITPNFNFGITMNFAYRNFDLAILFQGATGALLRFGTESGDIGNYLKYSFDNRWSIDRPSSVDPRVASRNDTYYTGGEFSNNTYFLFSKDYLRVKNVELGYNFQQSLIKRIGLNQLRVYVNGLNLITWDKFGGEIFDPETTNGAGTYYPQARVINTGLRLTF